MHWWPIFSFRICHNQIILHYKINSLSPFYYCGQPLSVRNYNSSSPFLTVNTRHMRAHTSTPHKFLELFNFLRQLKSLYHKVRHPRCVYNKLDWSLCTCITQLYSGIDMYNLLHKEQLHVSALFIGHLQVDKWETLVSSYTRPGEVRGGVGTRSRMCSVGRVVWVHILT